MDELALLEDMADETPLPSAGTLAPARARLMAGIATPADALRADTVDAAGTTAAGVAGTGLATVPRRHRRRLAIFGVATVGLAAAITAVVALGPLEQVGVAPQQASAEQVLLDAAAAAKAQPDVVPRPDQFVYTRSVTSSGDTEERWLPANWTTDGLVQYNNGATYPVSACESPRPRCQSLGYDPDMPTDVAGMREYLAAQVGGQWQGRPVDQASPTSPLPEPRKEPRMRLLFGTAFYSLQWMHMRPGQRAALFEVLADAEELTVVEHAVDSAGRSGTGIRWPDISILTNAGGSPVIMVFDKDTHAFLGFGGETTGVTTVEVQAFVDQIGQRP